MYGDSFLALILLANDDDDDAKVDASTQRAIHSQTDRTSDTLVRGGRGFTVVVGVSAGAFVWDGVGTGGVNPRVVDAHLLDTSIADDDDDISVEVSAILIMAPQLTDKQQVYACSDTLLHEYANMDLCIASADILNK